jgi:hypothetical protein
VDKNEYIEIKEFGAAFSKLDRQPYKLGSSKAAR